jgi:hypothetical protein
MIRPLKLLINRFKTNYEYPDISLSGYSYEKTDKRSGSCSRNILFHL